MNRNNYNNVRSRSPNKDRPQQQQHGRQQQPQQYYDNTSQYDNRSQISSSSSSHHPSSSSYQQQPYQQRSMYSNHSQQQQQFQQHHNPIYAAPQPVLIAQPPQRMMVQQPMVRRQKTIRHIQLTPQGNLVIDMPVPEKVLQHGKFNSGDEFTHMRYSAATTDPNDFQNAGFTLRQNEYNRQTELFIVVTMYNEDDQLFNKTMTALFKNISHLTTRTKSKTWGSSAWQKVVVCIVSDGRTKINQRVLNVLGVMGVFQEGIMKDHVNGKPVTGHVFEYTTQLCVDNENKIRGQEKDIVPVQILFCLKEKNAKKINSHRWFFNAFAPLLNPNVCILIDVGTKPTPTSLYHLWKAFDKNPSVGGACGEIYAELGAGCTKLLNPLVAAQNFEYKISNILDKPLESMFGYISVLPGAFSAYRYRALIGRPLQCYFKGELQHSEGGADIFAANMYLAEDRILCFELVTKEKEAWVLKYVKAAKAETDVPDGISEFISQRRRWLNGSFFAGVHALTHWYYIVRSSHGVGRKIALFVEFFYNFLQLIFSWIALSSFYLVFYFLGNGRVDDEADPFFGYNRIVFEILRQLYLVAIVSVFISSLGNRPQGSKWIYISCMVLFSIIMIVILYLAGFAIRRVLKKSLQELNANFTVSELSASLFSKGAFRDLVISTLSTYGMYLICSIAYFEPWHMFTSMVQYLLLLPSFVNILSVYSFCNLHDISWGTKGDNKASDLGGVTAVKGKDGKQTVEIDFPSDRAEINSNYESFVQGMRKPKVEAKQHRDAKTKQDDYFRNFRTKTVLLWVFSNALLIVVLTNDELLGSFYTAVGFVPAGDFNPYLKFIFYSVAVLSSIRFIGSISYLISYMMGF